MKTLRFLKECVDKNTRAEYKKGDVVEFEDKRADEILSCNGYAKLEDEVTEEVVQAVATAIVEEAEENEKSVEEVVNEIVEESKEDEVEKVENNVDEVVYYDELTIKELKEIAKEKEIVGYSDMKKAELIEAIKNA